MLPKDFSALADGLRWFRRFVRLTLFRTIPDIAPASVHFVVEIVRSSGGPSDDAMAALIRDYESRIDVSEAMIHDGLGSLSLRRIAH